MRRRNGNGLLKPLLIIVLSVAVVISSAVLVYKIFFNRVYKNLSLQAGSTITVADMMRTDFNGNLYEGELISITPDLDTSLIGEYKAKIKSGPFTYTSTITIFDMNPPSGVPREGYIFGGYSLMPSDFFTTVVDETSVNISYKTLPDFTTAGNNPVLLELTDAGGNRTDYNSNVCVCPLDILISVEAGKALDLFSLSSENIRFATSEEIENFCNTYDVDNIANLYLPEANLEDAIFESGIASHIGIYKNFLNINGVTYLNFVRVFDNTAPEIIGGRDLSLFIGDNPEPIDFIESFSDDTDAVLSFDGELDTTTATMEGNKRTIVVVATDEYGNNTSISCRYTVEEDIEPPLILGVSNLTTVIGEPFAFRRGITVTDNHDKDLEVVVNSDEVDLNTLGTYILYYTATDSAGNVATRSCDLTVVESMPKEVTEEEVLELANIVLDRILTDDMTEEEKVEAIYWYVYNEVHYNDGFDSSSWLNSAYTGLTVGMGDCYVSASTAQALFTAAGIPNMMIAKIYNGYSHHFWNIIDIGEGWHHFDATRRLSDPNTHIIYFTDEEIQAYSNRHYGSHHYDETLYPEIA